MKDFKTVLCEECGREMRVELLVGEREEKDGYHGECPGGFCGYKYFESIEY